MNNWWADLVHRIPASARPVILWLANMALGFVLAVVLHYVLFRIGLPSKPFIYVAF